MRIFNKKRKEIVFGVDPQKCVCPFCNNNVITVIEYQSGYITLLLSFIILLISGFLFSIFFIPIAILLTKSLVHKCSVCFNELGNDGYVFAYFNIKEKVVTYKIGEVGFILTRKIMLGIFFTILLIGIVAYKIHHLPIMHKHFEHYHPINDDWQTFLSHCSRYQFLIEPQNAHICSNKYLDKGIHHWSGHIIRISDYRESFYKYLHHAVGILIRMEPPESETFPDVLLTLDTEEVEIHKDLLNEIERGQKIGFNATIKSVGIDLNPKHLHSHHIWKEEGYMEISPLINTNGRYTGRAALRKNQLEAQKD